ncbi:hypothetical protein CY34DRAFT_705562 [Suillus luteus UH-Slu-Lm8-n1]|uniref:Uncharacterized protein n=1 Tax=Suillus luteus UH-Slu-Lm8-n1 TaxID=930992 RepID=A0A0D0ADI6_9AGAM|nr:hypothetical protein CY34DRAFT_705562 [Suillus luteus UH-Slu-Lm8-n1]
MSASRVNGLFKIAQTIMMLVYDRSYERPACKCSSGAATVGLHHATGLGCVLPMSPCDWALSHGCVLQLSKRVAAGVLLCRKTSSETEQHRDRRAGPRRCMNRIPRAQSKTCHF